MPKKRIIAVLVCKGDRVVQSIGFARHLPVGRPKIQAAFLDSWGIDEIVLLDIDAAREDRIIDPDTVRRVSESCFVPITAGGGIRTPEDIRRLLLAGADKVAINTAAIDRPALLGEAAADFGVQCLVASIDARRGKASTYRAFVDGGRRDTGATVAAVAQRLARAGAGEILINAIDQDGRGEGYDLVLAHQVASAVQVPVIVCGGAGHWRHLRDLLIIDDVAAAAAANFLHFTEHSVAVIKSRLAGAGIDVRLESDIDYGDLSVLEESGRLAKLPDEDLLDQFFEYVEEELI